MPLHVYLACTAVALSIPLLWWSLGSDRRAARARELLQSTTNNVTYRDVVLAPSAMMRLVAPVRRATVRRLRRLTPLGMIERTERRINRAGVESTWTVERVLSAKIVVGGILFVLPVIRAVASGRPIWILASVGLGVVGYFVPDAVLASRGEARQEAIRDELPDTIDQVMISVQAGLSFDAAVDRVAQTGEGPFAEELHRLIQDIRLGLSRREAMHQLVTRTDVAELREFVAAMTQAEAYGLSVADVLKVQADELRDKRKQRAEERAQKIPVKMLFPLIFCLLPCLFIVILGPGILRAFDLEINV